MVGWAWYSWSSLLAPFWRRLELSRSSWNTRPTQVYAHRWSWTRVGHPRTFHYNEQRLLQMTLEIVTDAGLCICNRQASVTIYWGWLLQRNEGCVGGSSTLSAFMISHFGLWTIFLKMLLNNFWRPYHHIENSLQGGEMLIVKVQCNYHYVLIY